MLMFLEADKRLVLAEEVPVMASKASTRFLRCFISSPVKEDFLHFSEWRYNMLLKNAWGDFTQSNKSKEEAKEQQQGEQEAQQPLPPAAA